MKSGGSDSVSHRELTTVLTTTVTTVAVPGTPPTRPFAANLAWLLRLPAPGSVVRWVVLLSNHSREEWFQHGILYSPVSRWAAMSSSR